MFSLTCMILLSTHRATTAGYSPVSGSIANPRNYKIRSQAPSPAQRYPSYGTEERTVTAWVFWCSSHGGVYFSSVSNLVTTHMETYYYIFKLKLRYFSKDCRTLGCYESITRRHAILTLQPASYNTGNLGRHCPAE